MAWPSTLSSFSNPLPTDRLNSPSHSSVETAQNTALSELQNFIGVNTGVNSSALGTLLYDVKAPGSNGGGHVQTANKGGTGHTSYTKGDLLVGSSSSVIAKLGVGGAGQVLVVNSEAATGVQWGSIAGIPTSIVTTIPRPPLGVTLASGSFQYRFSSPSVATVWQFPIHSPTRVSVITFQVGDAVDSSGTMDFTIYTESGNRSVLTVTTPAMTNPYEIQRAYPTSVVTLDTGNYYGLANTNAVAVFEMPAWTTPSSVLLRMANIPGEPVLQGTYIIAGGTPPNSIVTTAITSVATTNLNGLYFRIDG